VQEQGDFQAAAVVGAVATDGPLGLEHVKQSCGRFSRPCRGAGFFGMFRAHR
jgi:hypothetical protein